MATDVGVDVAAGSDVATVVADVDLGFGAELVPLTTAKMTPPSPRRATTSRTTVVVLNRCRCVLEVGSARPGLSPASIGTSTQAEWIQRRRAVHCRPSQCI